MGAFYPKSYVEALERAQAKPKKPRKPLKARKPFRAGANGKLARTTFRASQKPLKPRKAAKKAKRLTDGQLKKRVWKQFSIFIRTRDADQDGMVKCTTCVLRQPWTAMQAGHFLRGRLNANLFDERGTNVQCVSCNVYKQGEVVIYYKWMLAHYGQEVIDELIAQNNQTHKWSAGELQGLLDKYKAINAQNSLVGKV